MFAVLQSPVDIHDRRTTASGPGNNPVARLQNNALRFHDGRYFAPRRENRRRPLLSAGKLHRLPRDRLRFNDSRGQIYLRPAQTVATSTIEGRRSACMLVALRIKCLLCATRAASALL